MLSSLINTQIIIASNIFAIYDAEMGEHWVTVNGHSVKIEPGAASASHVTSLSKLAGLSPEATAEIHRAHQKGVISSHRQLVHTIAQAANPIPFRAKSEYGSIQSHQIDPSTKTNPFSRSLSIGYSGWGLPDGSLTKHLPKGHVREVFKLLHGHYRGDDEDLPEGETPLLQHLKSGLARIGVGQGGPGTAFVSMMPSAMSSEGIESAINIGKTHGTKQFAWSLINKNGDTSRSGETVEGLQRALTAEKRASEVEEQFNSRKKY